MVELLPTARGMRYSVSCFALRDEAWHRERSRFIRSRVLYLVREASPDLGRHGKGTRARRDGGVERSAPMRVLVPSFPRKRASRGRPSNVPRKEVVVHAKHRECHVQRGGASRPCELERLSPDRNTTPDHHPSQRWRSPSSASAVSVLRARTPIIRCLDAFPWCLRASVPWCLGALVPRSMVSDYAGHRVRPTQIPEAPGFLDGTGGLVSVTLTH